MNNNNNAHTQHKGITSLKTVLVEKPFSSISHENETLTISMKKTRRNLVPPQKLISDFEKKYYLIRSERNWVMSATLF